MSARQLFGFRKAPNNAPEAGKTNPTWDPPASPPTSASTPPPQRLSRGFSEGAQGLGLSASINTKHRPPASGSAVAANSGLMATSASPSTGGAHMSGIILDQNEGGRSLWGAIEHRAGDPGLSLVLYLAAPQAGYSSHLQAISLDGTFTYSLPPTPGSGIFTFALNHPDSKPKIFGCRSEADVQKWVHELNRAVLSGPPVAPAPAAPAPAAAPTVAHSPAASATSPRTGPPNKALPPRPQRSDMNPISPQSSPRPSPTAAAASSSAASTSSAAASSVSSPSPRQVPAASSSSSVASTASATTASASASASSSVASSTSSSVSLPVCEVNRPSSPRNDAEKRQAAVSPRALVASPLSKSVPMPHPTATASPNMPPRSPRTYDASAVTLASAVPAASRPLSPRDQLVSPKPAPSAMSPRPVSPPSTVQRPTSPATATSAAHLHQRPVSPPPTQQRPTPPPTVTSHAPVSAPAPSTSPAPPSPSPSPSPSPAAVQAQSAAVSATSTAAAQPSATTSPAPAPVQVQVAPPSPSTTPAQLHVQASAPAQPQSSPAAAAAAVQSPATSITPRSSAPTGTSSPTTSSSGVPPSAKGWMAPDRNRSASPAPLASSLRGGVNRTGSNSSNVAPFLSLRPPNQPAPSPPVNLASSMPHVSPRKVASYSSGSPSVSPAVSVSPVSSISPSTSTSNTSLGGSADTRASPRPSQAGSLSRSGNSSTIREVNRYYHNEYYSNAYLRAPFGLASTGS